MLAFSGGALNREDRTDSFFNIICMPPFGLILSYPDSLSLGGKIVKKVHKTTGLLKANF